MNILEGFLNKDDIYLNFDKWNKDTNPILFITGVSGGGKSTLANKLAIEYNAEIIHLDYVSNTCRKGASWLNNRPNVKGTHGDIIHRFDKLFVDTHKNIKWGNMTDTEHEEVMQLYLKWLYTKCVDKLYIVEGVQICTDQNFKEKYKDSPLIILGVGQLTSYIRRITRAIKGFKFDKWEKDLKLIYRLATNPQWVSDGDKIISDFRDNIVNENLVYGLEGFLDKDDIYLNFDKWNKYNNPILFITGISGGGKSTLANKLANEYNAEIIHLDMISGAGYKGSNWILNRPFDIVDGDKIHDLDKLFVSTHKNINWGNMSKDDFYSLGKTHLEWIIKNCKGQLYIVEGSNIAFYPEIFEKYSNTPIIILGAGQLTSYIRRITRSIKQFDYIKWERSINRIIKLATNIQDIAYNDKIISDFRDNIVNENLVDELEYKRKQLENELYIMKFDNKLSQFDTKKIHSLYYHDNPVIMDKIDTVSKFIDMSDRINRIIQNCGFKLTQDDIFRLTHTKYIDRVIGSKFDKGCLYYFGVNKQDVFVIGRDLVDNQVVYKLVLVNDECYEYLQCINDTIPKITVLTIRFPINNDIDYQLEKVTEGLSINENGDIKISINPKKSYMNEYAEAHRILVENYKNKNYEAMKQNVAFMFLLISIIERDPKYKTRDKEIVKARAFAINDFKTYLSYIQKEDPSFNFERYYKDSEFDKYVVNIPKETILGIRNLLKSILM